MPAMTLEDMGCCCTSAGPCTVTVCVFGCAAGAAPGLAITCSSGASCTTGPANCCSLTLPGPGTYTFTATDALGDTQSVTQAVACGDTVSITFNGWGFCVNSTAALNASFAWTIAGVGSGVDTGALTWFPLLFGASGGWAGQIAFGGLSGTTLSLQVPAGSCFIEYDFCGEPPIAIGPSTFTCSPFDFQVNLSESNVCGVSGFNVSGTLTITP